MSAAVAINSAALATHILNRSGDFFGSATAGARRGARVDASAWRPARVRQWEADGALTPLPLGSEEQELAKQREREQRRQEADETRRAALPAQRAKAAEAAVSASDRFLKAKMAVVAIVPDDVIAGAAADAVKTAAAVVTTLEDGERVALQGTDGRKPPPASRALLAARAELAAMDAVALELAIALRCAREARSVVQRLAALAGAEAEQ